MTDTQLHFAIGIPGAFFALNFLAILVAAFWEAKRFDDMSKNFGSRFNSFKKLMAAGFKAAQQLRVRVEGVLDARLKHLEDCER
jgi:hypothetical protein